MMPGPVAVAGLAKALGGMIDDPDVTGDLLLVGVGLARHVFTASLPWRLEDAVVGLFDYRGSAASARSMSVQRARVALALDVPRYDEGHRPVGGVLARHLTLIDWPRVWDDVGGAERPVDAKRGVRLVIDPHADDDAPEEQPRLRLVRL